MGYHRGVDASGRPRFARVRGAWGILLVAACAGSSVTVTRLDSPPAAATPRYDRAATAIQHGALEEVAKRPDATPDERELAAALLDVEMGRLAAAEPVLERLAAGPPGYVRDCAANAHVWLLFGQSRWADLLRLYPEASESARIVPLARGWAGAAPERVTFTSPSATLPATLEGVDSPFVEVRVGDRPYRFLLDTGATFTLITSDVAAAAGIRPLALDAEIGTATTNRLSVKPAVIPRLVVGNAVFENHPCVVTDPEDMEFTFLLFSFLRIDGVVGWNAIQRMDVEIDFRVPAATIREPSPRAVERNLFWLGKPLVRARLADGVPVLAQLDTGAKETRLLPPFFEAFPQDYRDEAVGSAREGSRRVWGAGGSERLPTRTVERLSVVLDGHLLEFRNLESFGFVLVPVFRPVLQFGNDIALKGTMRIDFANGALEIGP